MYVQEWAPAGFGPWASLLTLELSIGGIKVVCCSAIIWLLQIGTTLSWAKCLHNVHQAKDPPWSGETFHFSNLIFIPWMSPALPWGNLNTHFSREMVSRGQVCYSFMLIHIIAGGHFIRTDSSYRKERGGPITFLCVCIRMRVRARVHGLHLWH